MILQPSYIPWRGHFDLVRRADVFVFYDDVQYDKHGWRNRNRIKTPRGVEWLTVPVHSHGATAGMRTIDVRIDSSSQWTRRHLATLRQLYGRAPHFHEYLPWLERLYASPPEMLADFTVASTMELAAMLGITSTRFVRSSQLGIEGRKTDRLLAILQRLGAGQYLTGPSARSYIEPEKFAAAGIALEYMEYSYPEYPQLYPPYEPQLSVLDLLFMTGVEAPRYIWGAG